MNTRTSIDDYTTVEHSVYDRRTETVTMRVDGEDLHLDQLRAFITATKHLGDDTEITVTSGDGNQTVRAQLFIDRTEDTDPLPTPGPPSPRDLIARQIVVERLTTRVEDADVWGRRGLGDLPQDVIDYIAATANEVLDKLVTHLHIQ